jgi:hypothetical protein
MSFLDGYEDVNARIKRARAEFPTLRLVAYIEDIDLKKDRVLDRRQGYATQKEINTQKAFGYSLKRAERLSNKKR